MGYNHTELEQKWQKFWEENEVYRTLNPADSNPPPEKGELEGVTQNKDSSHVTHPNPPLSGREQKPKKYILDMFPYPSGAGLHVGHPKGYTATDIVSRYYHANGYNVLHTMGWDAFGLPAENYAIKTGTHPAVTTGENINTFLGQMKLLGFSYDWDRAVDTTDPRYYQWTQWIFLELFKRGLAYEQDLPINYCSSCKTGLANEEVLADNTCDRCGTRVEKRALRQWVLKITEYADRLIEDLDGLDWPEGVKEMQRNWIGKSEGCEFRMMKSVTPPGERGQGGFYPTKNSPTNGEIKKGRLPLSINGGGHNGLAKPSLVSSILEDAIKVKKKITFSGIIEGQIITTDQKKISFRSADILSHFRGKNKKEFIRRAGLLGTVFSVIDQIHFDESLQGYFFYKHLIIRVILGQQSNGNYFVKTYYVAEKLTEEYREYQKIFDFSRATESDFDQILAIRKKTGFHTIDFAQEQFFVAKKNNEIAGFIRTSQYGEYTELGALYVNEQFRGDKLGYKLISYAIEHTDTSEFYMDCKKELQGYYEKFGFTILNTAKPFQIEKLKKVWDSYGKNYSEQDILDITIFMTIKNDSTFPKLPSIEVYTTRIDTVFSMAFAAIAPDHPRVYDFITDEQAIECEAYITESASRSDQDRTNAGKEKTGVFTGSYVVNPYNGESVPLWIADFVLGHYGTGAVFGDAHDERDYIFAQKKGISLKYSIVPFCQYDGPSKPHQGEVFVKRDTVDIIMENDKGEILLLKEERGVHFPGGGLDGDEEIIGARREFTEETGYLNFSIKKQNTIFYRAFSLKRQHNLEGYSHFYTGNLLDNSRIESEVEQGVHEMIWVKKEDVLGVLTWANHILAWKQFLNPSAFCDDGVLINSSEFDGLTSAEARRVLSEKAETEGFGRKKVNYKLRDWLFSRQRYWGEPIPLIHISNEDYTRLPRVEKIEDAKTGEACIYSPLEKGEGERVTQNKDSSYVTHHNPSFASLAAKSADSQTFSGRGLSEEFLVIDGKIYSKIYDGINSKIIIDSNLPLTLPEVEKYEPAGDGQSPLATVPSFVNVKLANNLSGKRETNTMPQWGGSCWYYLRYMDPHNSEALASKEALDYWQNVDEYVGGAEHAVLHLLYARFWHKVLYDAGIVPTKEPFQKLTNVGMILAYAYERADGGLVAVDLVEEVPTPLGGGAGGDSVSEKKIYVEKSTGKEVKQVVAKMSKSLKNVINPNDIVAEYGADTLRLYEMSMGAFTDTAPWNTDAIIGVRRFLDKAYALFEGTNTNTHTNTMKQGKVESIETPLGGGAGGDFSASDMKKIKLLHKTVKKVGEDIVEYKFNTAIAALQILLNEGLPRDEEFAREWKEKFAILLHPFAPHMAEELFHLIPNPSPEGEGNGTNSSSLKERGQGGEVESIYFAPWPSYDDFMLVDDEVTIAVQVGGKLRGTFTFLNGVGQEEVSEVVRADEGIKKWLEGKEIIKEIFIPNKMLSIVVK